MRSRPQISYSSENAKAAELWMAHVICYYYGIWIHTEILDYKAEKQ